MHQEHSRQNEDVNKGSKATIIPPILIYFSSPQCRVSIRFVRSQRHVISTRLQHNGVSCANDRPQGVRRVTYIHATICTAIYIYKEPARR